MGFAYKKVWIVMVAAALISCAPLKPSGKSGETQPSPSPSTKVESEAGKHKPTRDEQASLNSLLLTPAKITFDDVFNLVLAPSCIECHGAEPAGNVRLINYDALLGQSGKKVVKAFSPDESVLYETLLLPGGSRHMPPWNKPQLSDDQIDLVYQWINLGAKDKLGQNQERPQTLAEALIPFFENPEKIDYADVNDLVFKENCLDCHSWDGVKANFHNAISYGQDMTTYEALLTNSGIVKDKLVDYVIRQGTSLRKKKGSRVYKSMAVNQTMPPTVHGYQPVDSLHVKLVRLWIQNCAIEDFDAIVEDVLLPEGDENRINGKVRDCGVD